MEIEYKSNDRSKRLPVPNPKKVAPLEWWNSGNDIVRHKECDHREKPMGKRYTILILLPMKNITWRPNSTKSNEGTFSGVKSLLGRDYIHLIGPSEQWKSLEWFGFPSLRFWDIVFLVCFLAKCPGPPQVQLENQLSNFDLKLCINKCLNETSLFWKFQIFWLLLSWNTNRRKIILNFAINSIKCFMSTFLNRNNQKNLKLSK